MSNGLSRSNGLKGIKRVNAENLLNHFLKEDRLLLYIVFVIRYNKLLRIYLLKI